MLNYLHDIRNKLTLISAQTAILSRKYGEDDFFPIKSNLVRISEIINEAYGQMNESNDNKNEVPFFCTSEEFINQMDLLTEAAIELFPAEITNDVKKYVPKFDYKIEFNSEKVFSVLENAIDNSIKASSTKLVARVFETTTHCVYELVDNGTGKKEKTETASFEVTSNIPHGIGKEIMIQNMIKIKGKVEWTRRIDFSGMIVRLYFPKQ